MTLKSMLTSRIAKFSAAVAVIFAVFISCGSDENDPDTPGTDPDKPAEGLVVNGTKILSQNTLYGLITDSKTGEGIPDVPVTDGYEFTTTDANGVYQFAGSVKCRMVYYTLPSGYKTTLDKTSKLPLFYSTSKIYTSGSVQNRNDFTLEPVDAPETDFTFVAVGDPQCKTDSDVSRFAKETIPDMKSYLAAGQAQGRFPNVCIMSMGDIIFDITDKWKPMHTTMSKFSLGSGEYVPFYNLVGNHDHDASATNQYTSVQNYMDLFGPVDYSFNKGDVHFVVVDDVQLTTTNGKSWSYDGGITDEQLAWIKADLALVKDKSSKMVLFCTHIPIRWASGKNFTEVLDLLTQFHEAHIMCGHTHYPQNYIHTKYVTKGGTPIYEHVHGAACGAWWNCNLNVNGQPNGYSVYDVSGNSIKNWVAKGTGLDEGYQMRVYNGSQAYGGSTGTPAGSYQYTWYGGGVGGSDNIEAPGNASLKGAFVAAVWNDDEANWKLEFWQNGAKVGDFQRVPSKVPDICVVSFWFNEFNMNTTTWTTMTAQHYWYFKAPGGDPATEQNWEVRAVQTIPSSGEVNTYKCTTLQTDYTGFK